MQSYSWTGMGFVIHNDDSLEENQQVQTDANKTKWTFVAAVSKKNELCKPH